MANDNESNKNCLTFKLGDVSYAVDVRMIREIIAYEDITPVPRTTGYLKGVMNIRGNIVPIIDFRVLFGIPVQENGKSTSIIVTEVQKEDESATVFGFITDAVEGVKELNNKTVQNLSSMGLSASQNRFITNLGQSGDSFILVLDPQEILRYAEEAEA